MQIGFVVRDRESMEKYDRLYDRGSTDGSVPAATYRGKTADVKLDIAIGHSGHARDRTDPVGLGREPAP